MSFENRDYYRQESARYGGGMGFGNRLAGASVVMWILVGTAIVFILDTILTGSTRGSAASLSRWGNFNVEQAVYGGQIWRWFTYQFLHANFLHIFFNMLILYFFGPMMERWWGSKRFLAFYLLCGVGGAIMMTLLSFVPGLLHVSDETQLIGASGSIMGILIGMAVLYPNMQIQLLIPPIPLRMRTLAIAVLAIAVLTIFVGGRNAGGEAAHLGGAAFGALFVFFPFLLDWADRLSLVSISTKGKEFRQTQHMQKQADLEAEVDRILDKVSSQGLQSLTKQEKKTLNRATQARKNINQ